MSSKRKDAMAVVLKREGFEGDLMGFLDEFAMESVVPGICLDCHEMADVEPDQEAGWCEGCQDGSMRSALILLGII